MNVVFVTEARFYRDEKGTVYGDSSFSETLWKRYLSTFQKIFVMARVQEVKEAPDDKMKVSFANVEFLALPYYVGVVGYVKHYFRLKKEILKLVHKHIKDAFIIRVPGNIGDMVINRLIGLHKKYALEVVGDPDDVFAEGGVEHPLRNFIRRYSVKNLKNNVQKASAVLYVTKSTLQKKYPTQSNAFSINASNVMIEFQKEVLPKKWEQKKVFTLLSVGSLEQMYKAPDILIEALSLLQQKRNDFKIHLKWLGGGQYMNEMIALAKTKKLSNQVHFMGQVSSEQVRKSLKEADLFTLVSRTEGLPRAIVEAMNEGLPVVATDVGGIPELLEKEVLVEKNDALSLAEMLEKILTDKNFYNQQAQRNKQEAKAYDNDCLSQKRKAFYHFIKTMK